MRRILFLCLLLIIFISLTIFSREKTNSLKFSSRSIHLVSGLLVNRNDAWNGNEDRKNESGLWLLDPLLDGIKKTVYNSDIYLSEKDWKSLSILDRFAEQSWKEYILKHLSIREDIDLRPIAQYKKSQECPYYLTYIIDHYDHLPDILLFSHGQPEVHNRHIIKHWSWFIKQVQQDLKEEFFNRSIGYLSANCGIYIQRYTKSRPILDLLGYNRTKDPLANQIRVLPLGTYCCGQFVVHRSRILQHPIGFWRLALKIVIDLNDCSHFEHLWHVFFGEPGVLDRQKSLPLWYEQAHRQTTSQCQIEIVN